MFASYILLISLHDSLYKSKGYQKPVESEWTLQPTVQLPQGGHQITSDKPNQTYIINVLSLCLSVCMAFPPSALCLRLQPGEISMDPRSMYKQLEQ